MYFTRKDCSILWQLTDAYRQKVRETMNQWGFAKDEFKDNGNWPYNIYVRESRRMLGEYVMTENDVLGKREVPKSIGMGSYTMDSHNVQRYVTPEGFVQNEGDIGVSAKQPYQIDLGSIMPKREDCHNLLVPGLCIKFTYCIRFYKDGTCIHDSWPECRNYCINGN